MKFMYKVIPVAILSVSIVMMLSGQWLKHSIGKEDDVIKGMTMLEQAVKEEDWDAAANHVEVIDSAWRQVVKRIQFSVERERIREVDAAIVRLKAAVSVQDEKKVIEEVEFFYMIWDTLGEP